MSKKYTCSGVDTSIISSLKFIMQGWKDCHPIDPHTKATFEWMSNFIQCVENGQTTESVPNIKPPTIIPLENRDVRFLANNDDALKKVAVSG